MKIIFATGNKGKLAEAREILGPSYEIITPADLGIFDDIEETGSTLKENSIIKARYIHERTGMDCFADDSGLEVDALGGEPGVHSARYAWEKAILAGVPAPADHDFDANIRTLFSELDKHPGEARTACFRTVVTLITNGEEHYFEGAMHGKIARKKSGSRGFGYDPVFIPDAFPGKTLAEVSLEDKDAISHRGISLRAMASWLASR
ncbi:MAG: RdgB/HAM1 family non-canonical purine NTP pyrophosphatase [Bacteroidales bacterium]|nr:RdgB/HAM1 family non-canonical purine NTP pyrophosphatase [Bacteroidales bacterium]